MPLPVTEGLATIFVKKDAFEHSGLARSEIDARFNLTDAEFRVEGSLIAIGPIPSDEMVGPMLEYLETNGLVYFEEVFELSGNWPPWLKLFAM